MSAIDDLIANAVLPEHVEKLCLRGDLVAQHELLDAELRELQTGRNRDERLNSTPDEREVEIADQLRGLEEQMAGSMVEFRLRAITRPEKARILLENPARPGNKADEAFGANVDTWFPAMLREALAFPKPEDDADFDKLVAKLSAGQFERLSNQAVLLSGSNGDRPFSRAASGTTRRSSATSG